MYRDKSEWAALAQLAWAVTNRLKPDPLNPQSPVPGFTLGLPEEMSDAERMALSAPTMMLARACAAVGRPYRALTYFEAALAECDTLDMRMHIGFLALDAAIEINDLAAATKYAALGASLLTYEPMASLQGSETFVLDHMIGRTIQIASCQQENHESAAAIDRAISVLGESSTKNVATTLLCNVLQAYRAARTDGNDAALEDVFQEALKCKALWAARDIAWYWCYRFSLGRSVYENRYFLWHWRLCWLSLEIGSSDTVYCAGVVGQERSYWNQIPKEYRSEGVQCILRILDEAAPSPEVAFRGLIAELATVACTQFDVPDVSGELSAEIRLSKDISHLARPLDALYIRFLELLLHPDVPHIFSSLQNDIECISESLRLSMSVGTETTDRFTSLHALAEMLERGMPSQLAYKALQNGCERAHELGANSAAQLYVVLRHCIQYAPKGFGFTQVSEILQSAQVVELLEDKGLLPRVRIRLATCHLTAKAFDAKTRLYDALIMLATQERMQSPITQSARASAKAKYSESLRELEAVVEGFLTLEAEISQLNLASEHWSCCLECGGTRRLVGAALLLNGYEKSARDQWLKPAVGDFRRAVEAARLSERAERAVLMLKAAFSGQSVARAVADQGALVEFGEVINEIRATGSYDDAIAAQESLESRDILHIPAHSNDRCRRLVPDNE